MALTKRVYCSYKGCSDRRLHHDGPDKNRPHQVIDVPIDTTGPCYCSIECAAYDGYFRKDKERKAQEHYDVCGLCGEGKLCDIGRAIVNGPK